jgi:hypothetical protein
MNSSRLSKFNHWSYIIALFGLPIPFAYFIGKVLVLVLLHVASNDGPVPGNIAQLLIVVVPLFLLYCYCATLWLKDKMDAPRLARWYASLALAAMGVVEYHLIFDQPSSH